MIKIAKKSNFFIPLKDLGYQTFSKLKGHFKNEDKNIRKLSTCIYLYLILHCEENTRYFSKFNHLA